HQLGGVEGDVAVHEVGHGGEEGAFGVRGALPEVGKVDFAQAQHFFQRRVDVGNGYVAGGAAVGAAHQGVADELQEVRMAGGHAPDFVEGQVVVDDMGRNRFSNQLHGRFVAEEANLAIEGDIEKDGPVIAAHLL